MPSIYLNQIAAEERDKLEKRLYDSQKGKCFICQEPIDLIVQANALDIDHVQPLKLGGKDDPSNLALTHSSCNRSKQASDLRVARVLAKFDQIREHCQDQNRGPNLSDVLNGYGGSKHELGFAVEDGAVRYSFPEIGDNTIHSTPVYKDDLSGLKYFFAKLPIAYLHHDDRINPRSIGGNLSGLVEEFFKKRPQLHVSLAWVSSENGRAPIKVFDGQHKAAAQVLLGIRSLPVRVFIDPDQDLLVTTNTNAGTTLRQVAFDKSVQRHLGNTLYLDRLERYRLELGLPADAVDFSERDLVKHFKGESREMKRYILDAVRDTVTHSNENKLRDYIDFGGRGREKPLSYSTVEKTFYSFFVYGEVLDTPLDYQVEEALNPRDLETRQIVHLMNLIAEEVYIGQYDPDIGTDRIESQLQKGKDIPEPHLRAFRMSKEEIIYVWLRLIRQIVQNYFLMMGKPVDDHRLFQYPFPDPLWDRLRSYVRNLKGLPVWVNHDLSKTIFGGKQNYDFWQKIFETGKTPSNQQVLAGPLDLMHMIKD